MSASVDVSCTVFGRVEKTVQSSPIPFFTRGERVLSLERSRSINPNSPNCFKFVIFYTGRAFGDVTLNPMLYKRRNIEQVQIN